MGRQALAEHIGIGRCGAVGTGEEAAIISKLHWYALLKNRMQYWRGFGNLKSTFCYHLPPLKLHCATTKLYQTSIKTPFCYHQHSIISAEFTFDPGSNGGS